jgi:alkylation response protein AidB-like acyl-CoA dehydrogenase
MKFTASGSPPNAPTLRSAVRAFLEDTVDALAPRTRAQSWIGFDAAFSRALGAQGWIGMPWPTKYGGSAQSTLDRYVIIEELLAAGAPVGAHWIADRQSGALLLRYACEEIKARYLPRIARGELCFCIGMSEPNAGSDLAAIRTRATRVDGGWRVNGQKLWTTNADKADAMIALVRTSVGDSGRHDGMSQLLIELEAPGVTVNAITDQTGAQHFGEVFFDDVFVPDAQLIGEEGQGWTQVNAELALERSGPERYLSSHRLLEEFLQALPSSPEPATVAALGEIAAELWCLRNMSLNVATLLSNGQDANLEACMVKDLGATFEQQLPQRIAALPRDGLRRERQALVTETLHYLLSAAPSFSLRGGTREILRGIIARSLGLR